MVIKHRVIKNQSLEYLYPLLSKFGNTFMTEFKQNCALAITVGDYCYDEVRNFKTYAIFLVFDINGTFNETAKKYNNIKKARQSFKDFLKFLRKHKSYLDDYVYTVKGHQHVVILKFPEGYEKAAENMLSGRFKEIYKPEDINSIRSEHVKKIYKGSITVKEVAERINFKFGTTISEADVQDILDYTPIKREEILNLDSLVL